MWLADRHNAWDMDPDGGYVSRRATDDDRGEDCQQAMIAVAEKRNFEANRLRKRKPRVLSRRARG